MNDLGAVAARRSLQAPQACLRTDSGFFRPREKRPREMAVPRHPPPGAYRERALDNLSLWNEWVPAGPLPPQAITYLRKGRREEAALARRFV